MYSSFQTKLIVRVSWLILFTMFPFLGYHLWLGNPGIAAVLLLVVIGEYLCIRYTEHGGKPFYVAHASALVYTLGTVYVIYAMGAPVSYWMFPAVIATFYILPMNSALVLNGFATISGTVLLMDTPEFALRFIATLILINVFGYVFIRLLTAQQQELDRLKRLDPLTLVGNQRAFAEFLEMSGKTRQRHKTPVAAIVIDIDRLRDIEERFGLRQRDEILVAVAAKLKQRLRQTDRIFRYGDQEFVIISLHTNLRYAAGLADQLREVVNPLQLPDQSAVQLSAGVAELQSGEPTLTWINRADQALFQARQQGGNRTCVADTPTAEELSPHPV